nr:hypothetical protein Iba_chr05cCG3370 [Ipomoea batatas]
MEEPEREEGLDGREHTAGLHPATHRRTGKKLADHDPADTRSPLRARHCCSINAQFGLVAWKERSRVHLAAKPATAFFEIDLYQSKQNLSYQREQQQNKRQNLKVTCRRSRPEFLTPDIFHRHTRLWNLPDGQDHLLIQVVSRDTPLILRVRVYSLQELAR